MSTFSDSVDLQFLITENRNAAKAISFKLTVDWWLLLFHSHSCFVLFYVCLRYSVSLTSVSFAHFAAGSSSACVCVCVCVRVVTNWLFT